VPLGPIAGISPFNFPLNLVAHKLAPAIAAGNPIVLRPTSQTPMCSLLLGEIVLAAGWPTGAIAVLPSSTEAARPLVEDDRIKLLTFTGSREVGWNLKARAGRKRVTLELGGNAAVIVNHDADVPYAAERIAWGGFAYSGQACISVQRVYCHRENYDQLATALAERAQRLVLGDPLNDATDIGPVIDAAAADRIEGWLNEAISGGATVLTGGGRTDQFWEPTILENVSEDMRVSCEEVFGPVICLSSFEDVSDAIGSAARSRFGLQAGIFTNDIRVIEEAFDRIEVGGLNVNDVPTFRIDHMPYGGMRESGLGREGLRYAIDEMTEMRLVTFNPRS
jgi:acyl-CoA reductase-like NAD-dependent aldehyde dehydrogenase